MKNWKTEWEPAVKKHVVLEAFLINGMAEARSAMLRGFDIYRSTPDSMKPRRLCLTTSGD